MATINPKFLEFIRAFAQMGKDTSLFPKRCRTCGKEYCSFPEYIHRTLPVAHGLEPYTDSLDELTTMQYRNCLCGSTLAINLTKESYPLLESFWEMINSEAESAGRAKKEVVLEFREECNRYIIEQAEETKR
jgi:hypothetical protein